MVSPVTLTFNVNKETVYDLYEKIISETPDDVVQMLDDVADIYKESMNIEAPMVTGNLMDLHVVESLGTYDRYIYSEAPYFDYVVDGHFLFGPVYSDKQRRWWFWYLANVLGGDYTPKVGSGNRLEGNNYPTRAYYDAQASVEIRLQEFLENIGSQ